ncbi:arylalkylamine N-acetyltransferase-like 2 isoform X2 [Procambarus clarkii]|uniref:arylalkylamine N-acetyltransferase-like 2 isoform X2 n=1 Tax=Procambarus clarkii TaxID=6728 RepID=UPI001E6756C5|nr:arylalkylamine N-acetyltransferase-like 2 [Procambarus clarkii]XP_045608038.1 arylalkylamine N-acetyltransferase-like 2 [Procambarus clarkii]
MGDANSLNYSDLTEKDVDEVVAFMAKHFYPREPISTGLHMTYEDNKEWIHGSVRDWVKNGVSVVAREPDTKAVAGTIIATILTRDQSNTYEQALTSPKTKVKTLHKVLSILETAVDFFSRYEKVDRILELAMITVSEKYSGRGVGRRLVQESERRGRLFGCTLATAQATAVPSQRLLYRLGYESLYTLDYATFEIAGDRVFDMDKMLGTPSAKVMARLIDESVDK